MSMLYDTLAIILSATAIVVATKTMHVNYETRKKLVQTQMMIIDAEIRYQLRKREGEF